MSQTRPRNKYKIGQIVYLGGLPFYQATVKIKEQYQRIVKITPWPGKTCPGQELRFANGDACHSKWVRPLTKKETGR